MKVGLILPIQRHGHGLDVLLRGAGGGGPGRRARRLRRRLPDRVPPGPRRRARLAAARARLARRADHAIKLGTLVLAGPLHDPARLAEDVLMLDWATRGRVILGLGTAHMPPDFELYGRPREHRGGDPRRADGRDRGVLVQRAVRLRGPLLPAQGPRHAGAVLAHADLDRRARPEGPASAPPSAPTPGSATRSATSTPSPAWPTSTARTAASRSCSSARPGSATTPSRCGRRTR